MIDWMDTNFIYF